MENRLIELETRVAFQENTLQALNAVIVRQQKEIDTLSRDLESVRAQLQALVASQDTHTGDEPPPPHY